MQYFFDESGNWKGRERKRLVLGGLQFMEANTRQRLSTEFKILKTKHNLSYLHANEMNPSAKEECYQIIAKYLERDAQALIHIYSPKILRENTRSSYDMIYMEKAAEIVSMMIFGDSKPKIYFDMSFHSAYPNNVISNLRKKKPRHFKRVINTHTLLKKQEASQLEYIQKRLKKVKKNNSVLPKFLEVLESNPKQAISAYLFSELILQVESKDRDRELFRAAIINNLKNYNESLASSAIIPEIEVNFVSKEQNNAGVEMIDIINNLVYHNGLRPHHNSSEATIKIYQNLKINEVTR
ncbi:MAG TPA: DUF3800 domain-containing protein [Candidatus Cloacimonetes bacterium]|nr:DUF3800 domain-containing protein [Candidatus Cloacimonadota bacterium]